MTPATLAYLKAQEAGTPARLTLAIWAELLELAKRHGTMHAGRLLKAEENATCR